jgi:hypothetical protein
LTWALEGCEETASRPGRTLPPGKTRYPLYRRLDGPQGRSGQVRKISPPLAFDPRTVHPVGSRYTDYATRPTINKCAVVSSILYCYLLGRRDSSVGRLVDGLDNRTIVASARVKKFSCSPKRHDRFRDPLILVFKWYHGHFFGCKVAWA